MSHTTAGSSAGTGGPVPQVTAKTDKGLPVPQVNRTGYIGGCQFRRLQNGVHRGAESRDSAGSGGPRSGRPSVQGGGRQAREINLLSRGVKSFTEQPDPCALRLCDFATRLDETKNTPRAAAAWAAAGWAAAAMAVAAAAWAARYTLFSIRILYVSYAKLGGFVEATRWRRPPSPHPGVLATKV
eukprot:scaffold88735_cov59-Phaeocystis_antarctica.AAC.1